MSNGKVIETAVAGVITIKVLDELTKRGRAYTGAYTRKKQKKQRSSGEEFLFGSSFSDGGILR